MGDRYLSRIFNRKWRFFLGGIILIIVIGFIFKNVGEIPYENQHLSQSSLAVKFKHQGETVRGYLYTFYWVETDPAEIRGMSENEVEDYIYENGRLNLEQVEEDFIDLLKEQSPSEIKDKYFSDYQYFKMRDFYYVKSDPGLEKFIKGQKLDISLPYTLKKVFFIYLDEDSYADSNNAYQYNSQTGSDKA